MNKTHIASKAEDDEMQKTLPPADVIEQRYPVTSQFAIWMNNWLVCGTDRKYIADMLVLALNAWSLSDSGKQWYYWQRKADSEFSVGRGDENQAQAPVSEESSGGSSPGVSVPLENEKAEIERLRAEYIQLGRNRTATGFASKLERIALERIDDTDRENAKFREQVAVMREALVKVEKPVADMIRIRDDRTIVWDFHKECDGNLEPLAEALFAVRAALSLCPKEEAEK